MQKGSDMSVKDYKISVITPIYNVEDYLEEAIESVIGQTLGFKDNVQLILVNDGSPDESYKICEKYKSLYPENIVYIEKENGGVSSARNEGLRHVKGRYVVFLDGDDLWEKRSFKKIVNFFDANYEQIDVCSCRLEYIGDFSKRKHPLEYKYKEGDRVIDLIENPTYICTTIGNSVFKSKSIENHYFDETMQYCEDAWFQNTVIAEKQKVGIVAGATFYYRKGETVGNTSLSVTRTDFWYFSVPENYYLKLLYPQHLEQLFPLETQLKTLHLSNLPQNCYFLMYLLKVINLYKLEILLIILVHIDSYIY